MEKTFTPKNNTVTDVAYEKLFRQIISGRYRPGDRLPPENELREEFGVSRNVIRTVLNKLNTLGIVETRRGSGSYIKQPGLQMYLNTFIPAILINESNLLELIQLRKAIEIADASLAAERATPEDIQNIENCYELSMNAGDNMKIYAESTIDFHYQIAVASKSQIFTTMMEIIKFILTSKMENFLIYNRNDRNSNYYHRAILEAIKNRKPDEAAFLMERHMDFLVREVHTYNEYIQAHPDFSLRSTQTLAEEEKKRA